MPLRIVDLRGTEPPFDAALPRPEAPGAEVHDAVATILGEVRHEGDQAVVRYTAELDKVDVSDGLRVPAREIEEARAAVDPALSRALEVAFGRILAYHGHEGLPPVDLVEDGIRVRHLTRPVGRAGIYAPGGRARYPSTVLMCAAPARRGGCHEHRPLRAPGRRRQGRRRHALRRLDRRSGRGLPDRWGAGDRRHGLRDAQRARGGRDRRARQRVRRRGQAAGVGRRGRRLRLRRAVRDRGRRRSGCTPDVRRRRPRRAGRARARRAGLAGDVGCIPRRRDRT